MLSRCLTTMRPALAVCAGILLYGIAEEAIFGSGWYRQFLDPESFAGSVELCLHDEASRAPSGVPAIAVIGNSMLAEGFSAKVADREAAGRFRFLNLSIPSSTPRCWYYLLRAVDPDARRHRAIVIQVEQYSDEDGEVPMDDSISDVHVVDALLKPSDILEFAFSFRKPRLQFEALRGALLKGYIFKQDVQAFLEAPSKRLEMIALVRRGHPRWNYDYPGHPESLSGMTVDWARASVTLPPGVPGEIQQRLKRYLLRKRAPLTGAYAAYRRHWFGRILEHYASSGTRIVFVRVPRGPAVNPSFDRPDEPSTIRVFASRPHVTVLPEATFQSLEAPENFWDELHMNARGRERFSRMLAHEVVETR